MMDRSLVREQNPDAVKSMRQKYGLKTNADDLHRIAAELKMPAKNESQVEIGSPIDLVIKKHAPRIIEVAVISLDNEAALVSATGLNPQIIAAARPALSPSRTAAHRYTNRIDSSQNGSIKLRAMRRNRTAVAKWW